MTTGKRKKARRKLKKAHKKRQIMIDAAVILQAIISAFALIIALIALFKG